MVGYGRIIIGLITLESHTPAIKHKLYVSFILGIFPPNSDNSDMFPIFSLNGPYTFCSLPRCPLGADPCLGLRFGDGRAKVQA